MATYTGSDKRLQYLFEHGGGGGADMWTGTMAEYEQQASQIEDGTLVGITDDDQIAQTWHVYSTTEKVVGVWLNNKPIYEKTVEFGALPNADEKTVAHNISNLEQFVSVDAIAVTSTGGGFPLSYADARNVATSIGLYLGPTNITIRTGTNRSGLTGYVTLRYTKSTD